MHSPPPKPPPPLPEPPPGAPSVTQVTAPTSKEPSASSHTIPTLRLGYGRVSDPHSDFYQMLHLGPRAQIQEVEEALRAGIRWWNGQQANPKYRHQAPEALSRLREARETLLDPMKRQAYDRSLQAFRHAHREARWQPIRDLFDTLLADGRFTVAREDLIIRYAQKRGLDDEEIERMLEEEALHHGVPRPYRPQPGDAPRHSAPVQLGYRLAMGTLFLSLVGLLLMPLYQMARPAVLLLLPLLNDLRLLYRGLTVPERQPTPPLSGWDLFIGSVVLVGSSVTAIVDMRSSSLIPLGVITTLLLWIAWLQLTLLWQKTPLRSQDPFEEDPF